MIFIQNFRFLEIVVQNSKFFFKISQNPLLNFRFFGNPELKYTIKFSNIKKKNSWKRLQAKYVEKHLGFVINSLSTII